MLEQLDRFLAVNGFIPHGYCINWSTPLVSTFVASDLLIFLSYTSMPVALGYFARKRADFPYRGLLWMFAAFIVSCGLTHLMDIVVLWEPAYRLHAVIKAFTAATSVVTAVLLWPMIPRALKLASPTQLRIANEKLEREIAQRKRAEEELWQAKQATESDLARERILLAAIVESSEDGIISKRLDGTITSWNAAAEKMFGYSAAETVGKCKIDLIIPAERLAEEAQILAAIRRGESIRHFETVRAHRDGHAIDVSVTVSPVRDAAGNVIGASKIVRDISERKAAQAKILELNATLERRVEERTAELRAANAELEAFAYTVSHDLRAPVRAILGFSKILLEDYGHRLDGEGLDCIEQVAKAGKSMGELIEGLLVLSRVTRGDLNRVQVDVTAAAQRIRDELSMAEPGRHVTWEIEPGMSAYGDERMIGSALGNLLGNAWKYTQFTEHAVIRVSRRQENGAGVICVADNGAGFDMRYAAQLFQPFRRLHRQDEFQGLGIGLATVQRIVHRHGGRVTAQAEPGRGAEFRIFFPEQQESEIA